jgi:hypothetical protein
MDAFTAFCHEFFNGRLRMQGFQQFDPAVAQWNHCQVHSLVLDGFIAGNFQPEGVFIDLYGVGQRPHCDSNVIDFHDSNLAPRTIPSTIV